MSPHMDDTPYAIIELGPVFGSVLAWAAWEVIRNRHELARLRGERDGP